MTSRFSFQERTAVKMLPPLDACHKLKLQWPDSHDLLLSVLQH